MTATARNHCRSGNRGRNRARSSRRSEPVRAKIKRSSGRGASILETAMTIADDTASPVSRIGLARLPGSFAAFILSVDVVALVWVVVAVCGMSVSWRGLGVLGLVVAVAVLFEEVATRATRLQYRLTLSLKRDMVSVWAVAGAVALGRGQAALLMAAVLVYIWFRQQRPAGEILHRKWFSASTETLGCLIASVAADALRGSWPSLPWALSGAFTVVVAMAVYALVNRVLVTVALVWAGARGRDLLGSRDANLIELATLCLGGLVALAILSEPWLVVLALVPMITLQRGAVVRELEAVATTDAKTGLLNAVALEHLGQREIARAERESTALSVLIVDIDRFKLVNDRHGHLVGDSVLKGVGRALTLGLREYDTVGRFGGEEFVAILPAAQEAEALVVAERLRAHVEALRITELDRRAADAEGDRLSVSIGVACYGTHGFAMSDLLFAADTALYRAKAGGRNRVVLADGEAGGPARESLVV